MRKMSVATAEKKLKEASENQTEDINQVCLEIITALDLLEIPYIIDFKDPDCGICCEKHIIGIAYDVGSLNSDNIYLNVPHKDRISIEYPGCKHMFHAKCVYDSCNSGGSLGIKYSNTKKTYTIECGYCRHTFYDKGLLNNLFAKSISDLYNPVMNPVSASSSSSSYSVPPVVVSKQPSGTAKYKHVQCNQILKSTKKQCKNMVWILKEHDNSKCFCSKHKPTNSTNTTL